MQEVGQALLEHAVIDADDQLTSGSFMNYAMLRADMLVSMATFLDQSSPSTTNILGAKGAGEGGALGAPPVVVSALADALGVHHIDMPLWPEKIWRMIRSREELSQ